MAVTLPDLNCPRIDQLLLQQAIETRWSNLNPIAVIADGTVMEISHWGLGGTEVAGFMPNEVLRHGATPTAAEKHPM